jgi:metallo-beta-lactamase class B
MLYCQADTVDEAPVSVRTLEEPSMLRRLIPTAIAFALSLTVAPRVSAQPTPARINPGNDLATMAREPFMIFDNLYFVGIGEVGSYVLETSAGLILLGQFAKLGLDPMDIVYVLILQGHRDHFGGAPALQKIIDARFGTAEEDRKLMVEAFGEYAPRIDFIIDDGDTLTLGDTTLHFELTPGHTPGTTSIRFPVFDHGERHEAYFHGGPSVRSDDPAVIERFIADLERIKRIPDIDVQIGGHFDSYLSGSGDLFDRAALLAARRPGELHPWVRPAEFQAFLDERIAIAGEALAAARR